MIFHIICQVNLRFIIRRPFVPVIIPEEGAHVKASSSLLERWDYDVGHPRTVPRVMPWGPDRRLAGVMARRALQTDGTSACAVLTGFRGYYDQDKN